ncbi:MAG: hypothetical protein AVDCRST_MAG80-2146, partial [uncultured Rubrobacteraceae bacterium]
CSTTSPSPNSAPSGRWRSSGWVRPLPGSGARSSLIVAGV